MVDWFTNKVFYKLNKINIDTPGLSIIFIEKIDDWILNNNKEFMKKNYTLSLINRNQYYFICNLVSLLMLISKKKATNIPIYYFKIYHLDQYSIYPISIVILLQFFNNSNIFYGQFCNASFI